MDIEILIHPIVEIDTIIIEQMEICKRRYITNMFIISKNKIETDKKFNIEKYVGVLPISEYTTEGGIIYECSVDHIEE